jgi:glycosyltransferase involved in cell wall biosynthesis
MKKEKLCYILPFFDQNTDTHYFHLYDFIEKAALELDIFLIIERRTDDVSYFKNVTHIASQRTILPFRLFENLYLILKARALGYKKFYIHYSQLSAINSSVVTNIFGGENWYWSCGMMWLFKEDRFNQFMWKLTLTMVDHLVTGTNSMAKGYSENYKLKYETIRIMPNWIDFNRFRQAFQKNTVLEKLSLDKNKRYILFVHRLAPRKGAHYIAPIAKNFDNNTVFLIAGDGPYRETLEKEVQDNNLKNVQILGKISNVLIPQLMGIADVFLMPSEEEGFPRVLIEAMASGLPYVASDIGGVKEISPTIEQPHICNVGDIASYSNSLKEILAKNKDYFKNDLLSEAHKYDQGNVLKTFINLFKK